MGIEKVKFHTLLTCDVVSFIKYFNFSTRWIKIWYAPRQELTKECIPYLKAIKQLSTSQPIY
jgi:hypothetical protein